MAIILIITVLSIAFVLLAALAILLLIQRQSRVHNPEVIRAALARLLERPYGAYVIIEEPSTGKFVQFSGSTEETLFFDLPRQTLTLEEFERARHLFSEFGYPGPETFAVYDSLGKAPTETQTSFNVSLGKDVEKGTELAMEVLERVYGFGSNVKLKLTEK